MLPASFICSYAQRRRFTDRQAEILQLVLTGATNEEVARELGFKVQVVKNYFRAMLAKTARKNRVELVVDVYDKFIELKAYEKYTANRAEFEFWMAQKTENHDPIRESR